MVKSGMGMEQLGSPQEKAARRPEVDRVKKLIKDGDLLKRRDPDFPSMGTGEKDVVRSFGIQGVETVDDLFNRTEAPNYDPYKAQEALRVMSTAVYESMIESGDPDLMEAVVAGSYSTERLLPAEWVGSDENDPENGSRFASMVVQNYIDKFSTREKRDEISATLEFLDFIKNSPYDQGDFLSEQAEEAYETLKKIRPNVMNNVEMDAYLKALEYVSIIKDRKPTSSREDSKRERGRLQRVIRPIGQDAGDLGPGGSDEYAAGLYELEFDDFVETAIYREQVPWRIENRPEWYKTATREKKAFFEATRKLIDGSSWFQFYQNSDLEKCWHNPSFVFSGKELNALMNDDFKLVSHWMLNDLCEMEITSDGVERLVYKSGKNGLGINETVLGRIANMEDYQIELATRLARKKRYPNMSETDIIRAESGVPTPYTKMDLLTACNAWNMFFMTFGSSLADRDRALAPNNGKVSDKIRTLNSEAKSRKKLQIFNMAKGVEMSGDNGSLLEAEWFGGGVSAWVEMVLTIEDATGKAMDGKKTLRRKIADKDIWFFDSPLLYSFYDTKEVEVDKPKRDERGRIVKDRNGDTVMEREVMTIGRALFEGRDFHFNNDENDTMSDFRDITEAAVRTWNVLVGKSQIKSNDLRTLTNELRSSVGLLNQIKLKGKLPGRISRVVSTPEFWGMCLVNTFGPNMDVLASDGIYVKGAISSSSYPEFLERLYNHLQLNDFVNPKLFKKFLKGDGGAFGQVRDRIRGMIRNQTIDQVFKKKWRKVEQYYEANRVEAESFVEKEKQQVAKWYNQSLQNGDMVAAERFKAILDGLIN